MSHTHLLVVVAFLTITADAKSFEACKENAMCDQGECCLFGICMQFVSVGKECSLLSQIMRLQCPCAIGSSCILTNTFGSDRMRCRNIAEERFKEMVENRDSEHIKMNRIDE